MAISGGVVSRNTINVSKNIYKASPDFTYLSTEGRSFFVHELTHIVQEQKFGNHLVYNKGLSFVSGNYNYNSPLEEGVPFGDWNIEQQAQFIQDYYSVANGLKGKYSNLSLKVYQNIIPPDFIPTFGRPLAFGVPVPDPKPLLERCFLAGTMVDMWPVEMGLKPGADGLFDEEEVRAKVWQKPIEEVTAKDWVLSFDQDGNLKPGRVKRTFENEAKIILDFHGTFVTPAHVYYCAGGTYEGKFVPLIDILRDDGVVQHADGSLIRASTGCEVGSEDDKPFWAFLLYEDEHGMERVREKRQLRLGTRWMMPNGKHFSMREYMEGAGIELVESGELEGYVRFKRTGLTTVFAWTLSDTLPNPEDFVLRRSQTTLEDIYRASEWESVHPQMPAPVTMDSGPVQPLSVQQFDNMPRNNPIGFQNNSPSSELKLNRKARKAEAARQRKIKKSRQKADKGMSTLH
jgi:hypothetical protein